MVIRVHRRILIETQNPQIQIQHALQCDILTKEVARNWLGVLKPVKSSS